jgi:hypothetical protein
MNAREYENKRREMEEAAGSRFIVLRCDCGLKKRVRVAHNVMLCQAGEKSK